MPNVDLRELWLRSLAASERAVAAARAIELLTTHDASTFLRRIAEHREYVQRVLPETD